MMVIANQKVSIARKLLPLSRRHEWIAVTRGVARNLLRGGQKRRSGGQNSPSGVQGQSPGGVLGRSPLRQILIFSSDGGLRHWQWLYKGSLGQSVVAPFFTPLCFCCQILSYAKYSQKYQAVRLRVHCNLKRTGTIVAITDTEIVD